MYHTVCSVNLELEAEIGQVNRSKVHISPIDMRRLIGRYIGFDQDFDPK